MHPSTFSWTAWSTCSNSDFSSINRVDNFLALLFLRMTYLGKSWALVTKGDISSGVLNDHSFVEHTLWKGGVCSEDYDLPTLSWFSLRMVNSNYLSSADRCIQGVQFPPTARQQMGINEFFLLFWGVFFCLFLDFSLCLSQKNFVLYFDLLSDTQHFRNFICTKQTGVYPTLQLQCASLPF